MHKEKCIIDLIFLAFFASSFFCLRSNFTKKRSGKWATEKLNKGCTNEIARFAQFYFFLRSSDYRLSPLDNQIFLRIFSFAKLIWSMIRLNQRLKSLIIHGNPLSLRSIFSSFRFESLYTIIWMFVTISEIFDRVIYHLLLERRMRRMNIVHYFFEIYYMIF